MSVPIGTALPLEFRITVMPEYDDNDQYIGSCEVNGVLHHITLFRVLGDDDEQEAGPGHTYRLDALQDFEDDTVGFMPIYVDDKAYLYVVTPQAL